MKLDNKKLRKMVLEASKGQDSIGDNNLEDHSLKKEWREFISSYEHADESSSTKEKWLKITNLNENLDSENLVDQNLRKTVDILKIIYDEAKGEIESGNDSGPNRTLLTIMLNAAGDSADSTGEDLAGKQESLINAVEFFQEYMGRLPQAAREIAGQIITFVGERSSPALTQESKIKTS